MSSLDFLFCENAPTSGRLVINIPTHLAQKKSLIDVYRSSGFPAYLANNWDSLFECLRDFSWVDNRIIQIQHHDLPLQDDAEGSRAYLSLLIDAIADWQKDEVHSLEVVFPLNCKYVIQKLLHR